MAESSRPGASPGSPGRRESVRGLRRPDGAGRGSGTGEIRESQIFVGVLGASNFTFAEATWTQTLPDWIGSHVRMFAYMGGAAGAVVPDNLRSGVKGPCFYDPDINPTYQDLAVHYGTSVLPARPRRR